MFLCVCVHVYTLKCMFCVGVCVYTYTCLQFNTNMYAYNCPLAHMKMGANIQPAELAQIPEKVLDFLLANNGMGPSFPDLPNSFVRGFGRSGFPQQFKSRNCQGFEAHGNHRKVSYSASSSVWDPQVGVAYSLATTGQSRGHQDALLGGHDLRSSLSRQGQHSPFRALTALAAYGGFP